ncbi:PREDICTED: MICOS complex subunit mic25 [Wasmannia auropunctata]|uniref:MICOS complex subunit mic25 n=1 Tax=Wasmannia auropunctata TaxID=64793 RepID=UPI0005F049C2|nr:PREDICTED: MICOS complex subunit mic25 [Wasmannia auropunctata]
MGSGQSARKLTISNEEEVGVIKVSNAIVQRLAQNEKSRSCEPSPPPSPGAKPTAAPTQHPAAPPGAATAAPQAGEATPGQPVYYYPDLTMSALQMQQQMEEELKRQDQHWQKRLQNLEDGYKKINHILKKEYQKTADETSITGQKIDEIQNTVQPCLENSNKVLKCFQDHPKETLKCSNLVEEFSNCVWNVHYSRVIETRS